MLRNSNQVNQFFDNGDGTYTVTATAETLGLNVNTTNNTRSNKSNKTNRNNNTTNAPTTYTLMTDANGQQHYVPVEAAVRRVKSGVSIRSVSNGVGNSGRRTGTQQNHRRQAYVADEEDDEGQVTDASYTVVEYPDDDNNRCNQW